MSPLAFDRLLEALVEAEIEFVLVGGLAVSAGGHAQHGESFLSSAPGITAAVSTEKQVVIETDLGRLDVVRGFPGLRPYVELRSRAVETEILGVAVNVCSLEDLRAMKRGAGGTRDLADLEELDAAEGEG